MVKNVSNLKGLRKAMKRKDEDFQTDLYEYTTDYLCIRARSKAGGLDKPPNVYISVRVYSEKIFDSNIKYLTPEVIEEPAISKPLSDLISLINSNTNGNIDGFSFKQYEDGGSVIYDTTVERLDTS